MISFTEARRIVHLLKIQSPVVQIPLDNAMGRTLAENYADDPELTIGERVDPARMGLLHSHGIREVEVYEAAMAGVVTVGGAGAGEEAQAAPKSTATAVIVGAMQRADVIPVDMGAVSTDVEFISAAILRAMDMCQIVCLIHQEEPDLDFQKLWRNLEGKLLFDGVAQQPGEELSLVDLNGDYLFVLPDEPAAALASFYLYTRPLAFKIAGNNSLDLPQIWLSCPDCGDRDEEKTWLEWVKIDWEKKEPHILSAKSHSLNVAARADGLAVVPPETEAGQTIQVFLTG